MNFKKGDCVRVRKDLKVGEWYGGFSFALLMEQHIGKKAKIKKIFNVKKKAYILDIDHIGLAWTDEMLEPYKETRGRKKKSITDIPDFYIANPKLIEKYKKLLGKNEIVDIARLSFDIFYKDKENSFDQMLFGSNPKDLNNALKFKKEYEIIPLINKYEIKDQEGNKIYIEKDLYNEWRIVTKSNKTIFIFMGYDKNNSTKKAHAVVKLLQVALNKIDELNKK